MPPLEISAVEVHDDAELRAFWDVEQAAMRQARAHPVLRSYEVLTGLRDPSPYYRHLLLAAREDGVTVGTADLGFAVGDNEHLADLEITVHPDRQRSGVGRALFAAAAERLAVDGRSSVVGEASIPYESQASTAPATAFARAMGATTVLEELHLVLDLPAANRSGSWARDGAPDWEIVTWLGHCPDAYAAAYCAMRTQMENDVPRGDLDYEPFVFDEERLRVGEQRVARFYDQIVAAARRVGDGQFGGYSMLFLPFGETYAQQDDTLVMPEHRGHRLGTRLKSATLEIMRRDHPELTAIHTWTAVENGPMLRTNRDFGYRPIERMHEMQLRLG